MLKFPKITTFLGSVILILPAFFVASGQNAPNGKTRVIPPSAETFRPYDGIISPGTPELNLSQDTLRIYDADGKIWYEVSYDYRHPLFYKNNDRKLKPFVSVNTYPLAMRIRAVSDHWYEIVPNEDTDESKFTLISDPFLKRETWQSVLDDYRYIRFDPKTNPVHDAPDGNVVEAEISNREQFVIRAVEGDWVQIRRYAREMVGWIRWRDEKGKFILGNEVNDWKLPDPSIKPQEKSLSKSIDPTEQ